MECGLTADKNTPSHQYKLKTDKTELKTDKTELKTL